MEELTINEENILNQVDAHIKALEDWITKNNTDHIRRVDAQLITAFDKLETMLANEKANVDWTDHFAGLAMQTLLSAKVNPENHDNIYESLAQASYDIADAMEAERIRRKEKI